MYEKTYGSKYERTKNLSLKEIAALVRAEIKEAVQKADLPKGKYSVRKEGHNSIRVELKPDGNVFTPGYLRDSNYTSGPREVVNGEVVSPSRYLPHVDAAVKKIEAMLWAYNYDGSDIQSDYFNVRFYRSVNVAASYQEARAALLAADADLTKAVEESAPAVPELDEDREVLLREEALSNVVASRAPVKPSEEPEQVRFLRMAGVL